MILHWPPNDRIHLANVRIPSEVVADGAPGLADEDGLVKLDLVIEKGVVGDLLPAGSVIDGAVCDADGGMLLPPFADLHAHLDKGHIFPRVRNPEGTLVGARAVTRADTERHWREEDVEARFEFALECAYAHGTAAIRTHIDCFVPGQAEVSFAVFRRLRERWSGRMVVEAAALVGTDLYDTPENEALVDLIAASDARLGGVTYRLDEGEDPTILDGRLDRLLALAKARRLDVDLHVDENGAPSSTTLAQVAEAVMRNGYEGHVVCGHCCSLSMQDEATYRRTIGLARDAGLTIVSLPMVNQFLQGRIDGGGTPRWRGIPLLRELKAAGVRVALASDNCRDAYHAFGDHDMLEVLGAGVRMGHLETELDRWPSSVTTVPAAVLGVAEGGRIRSGGPADFQLFCARDYSELLARRQPDRLVIRGGRRIEAALPDYRKLDRVVARGKITAIQ
jgi:cytosine deaminase